MTKTFQGNTHDPYNTHQSTARGAPSTVPITLHQASETAPLHPGKTQRTWMLMPRLCRVVAWGLALVFSLMVYQTFIRLKYCPPDPDTRDAIRLGWEKEKSQHAVLQQEWKREREERARERENERTKERKSWEHERTKERKSWEREVEERKRREEEGRQKLHMFWGHVEAHKCTTYATREYTAQLMNLPTTWKHRLDACKATPLEVHGISYFPKTCEDKGPGVVIGRWDINQQVPECTTFWDSYNDKGCTSPGSGRKHITHKLMNLPEEGDWRVFCATTPARFDHMQFTGAHECIPSIWGVYGQWEIDDGNC